MTSVDNRDNDKSFENEQSMVRISIKNTIIKRTKKYITDPSLISLIDKLEELTRALRKHIVRKFNGIIRIIFIGVPVSIVVMYI